MFFDHQLTGALLPPKTLCLTFDDGPGETTGSGPGPKTMQLAEYLHTQGVPATFFVVGRFVKKYPYVLPQLVNLGHTVANHTFNHPDFYKQTSFKLNENFASEILNAEAVISSHITGKPYFFRPPYGHWSAQIAAEINGTLPGAERYTGPVYWDIDCADWHFWMQQKTAEECADAFLSKIEEVGRGIVLMHDSTANKGFFGYRLRNRNLTYEMVTLLIPRLKSLGYTFVSLAEVPLS